MKDITQRFHDIHEEKSRFNLEPGVTEVQTIDDNWRKTSSDITEPIVYGRDHDPAFISLIQPATGVVRRNYFLLYS